MFAPIMLLQISVLWGLFLYQVLAVSSTSTSHNNSGATIYTNDRQLEGDFAWGIFPVVGYPVITFDGSILSQEGEAHFKYNFEGNLSKDKYFEITLFQDNCKSPADLTSLSFRDSIQANELNVAVDVIQANIADSPHYTAISPDKAKISFCLRIDYFYRDPQGGVQSINFHETVLAITVNLAAGFAPSPEDTSTSTAGSIEKYDDSAFLVKAFFCDDNSVPSELDSFSQDDNTLQVCVQLDDSITSDISVVQVSSLTLSQPDSSGLAYEAVADTIPDNATITQCDEVGICKIKTSIPSEFFADPANWLVAGEVLIAIGDTGRILRASVATPISDDEGNGRRAVTSDFSLVVSRRNVNDVQSRNQDQLRIVIILLVVVVCLLFSGIVLAMRNRFRQKTTSPSNLPVLTKNVEMNFEEISEREGTETYDEIVLDV